MIGNHACPKKANAKQQECIVPDTHKIILNPQTKSSGLISAMILIAVLVRSFCSELATAK